VGDTPGPSFDLGAWLVDELEMAPPVRVEQIAGGWSNITSFGIAADGRRVVVRQPPVGHVGGGAHDVVREARICAALQGTAVPAPEVLAVCDNAGIAPQPFYVMVPVRGEVVGSAAVAAEVDPAHRRALGFGLIDLLADLQGVDLDAVGLGSLRSATPYLRRQLRRWRAQWAATGDAALTAIDHVAARLEERAGDFDGAAEVLVHQDFRFGNVMIVSDPTPRISGLLDWELATVGHPLADLGFLGARMEAPEEVLEDGLDPSAVAEYPSFAELVAHYRSRSGVDSADIQTFVAMSAWRWAIIVSGIQQRISSGAMGDLGQSAEWHRRRVELLAELAADLIG